MPTLLLLMLILPLAGAVLAAVLCPSRGDALRSTSLLATVPSLVLAFDVVLFYVFFELTLVPLFFLIGIWGGPQRQHAARKFFIYTLTGSLITLLGVLAIVLVCFDRSKEWTDNVGELTFSMPRLVEIV